MIHEESAFKSSKNGAATAGDVIKTSEKLPALGSLLLGGIPLLGDLIDGASKSPFEKKKVWIL